MHWKIFIHKIEQPTFKSNLKDVALPWETPAAITAPECIMGPS